MKRSTSGRVPRKIASYDDEDTPDSGASSQSDTQSRPSENVVKRPTFGKTKKRSSLRMSFGPTDSGNDGDESSSGSAPTVVTPKKSNLSRIAMEKSAQLRARSPLVPEASRDVDSAEPTYSKDYINELRNSTPSTPKDLVPSAEEEELQALDVASKFGANASITIEPAPSAIPTQAEILEKKARRRRLALEQENRRTDNNQPWASDDSDDEFRTGRNEISLRPKEKYAESRLVQDDEDIAEGFDEYVEDGKVALGRKSEREARRKRRAEMAELINEAEGASDDDASDDSEERNDAFAAAQARAGRYGETDALKKIGTRTPSKISPLPNLTDILKSLRAEVDAKEQRRELIAKRLEELKDDKVRIEERKLYLQEQLQKTGEQFEKLRVESGMPALPANGAAGAPLITERGLDSLGTTPLASNSDASEQE